MVLEQKNFYLQQIRESEKRNRRFKVFLLYSDIKTTRQQADQKWYSVEKAITEKELRPSIFRKVILVFAAAFLCFWWITLFRIVPITLISIFMALPILPLIVYKGKRSEETRRKAG
jgi:Flp pilus assembly protein TadB